MLTSPATGLTEPIFTPSPTAAVMVGIAGGGDGDTADVDPAAGADGDIRRGVGVDRLGRTCTLPALPMVTPSPMSAVMALLTEVVAFNQATVTTPPRTACGRAGGGLRGGRRPPDGTRGGDRGARGAGQGCRSSSARRSRRWRWRRRRCRRPAPIAQGEQASRSRCPWRRLPPGASRWSCVVPAPTIGAGADRAGCRRAASGPLGTVDRVAGHASGGEEHADRDQAAGTALWHPRSRSRCPARPHRRGAAHGDCGIGADERLEAAVDDGGRAAARPRPARRRRRPVVVVSGAYRAAPPLVFRTSTVERAGP